MDYEQPAKKGSRGTARRTISVIMPMFNASHLLQRVLRPLIDLQNQGAVLEVIVVDDVSSDNSVAVASDLGATVLRAPRNSGPGAARNLGAAKASGDILWFVDSDVIVSDESGQHIATAFRDPQLVAVFGSYDDTPPAQNFMSQYKNLVHHYYHQKGREEASTFWAGCGAVDQRVFAEIGGFDAERYTKPSIEDIELGYRLRERGGRIKLCHDLRCTHLKAWTLGNVLRTDIFQRAIPWARLMLSQGGLTDDLNVSKMERGRAIVAGLLALSILTALLDPSRSWITLALLATVLACNWEFFSFLRRAKGSTFALFGLLYHQAYYLYSGAAFAWCWFEARFGGRLKPQTSE